MLSLDTYEGLKMISCEVRKLVGVEVLGQLRCLGSPLHIKPSTKSGHLLEAWAAMNWSVWIEPARPVWAYGIPFAENTSNSQFLFKNQDHSRILNPMYAWRMTSILAPNHAIQVSDGIRAFQGEVRLWIPTGALLWRWQRLSELSLKFHPLLTGVSFNSRVQRS